MTDAVETLHCYIMIRNRPSDLSGSNEFWICKYCSKRKSSLHDMVFHLEEHGVHYSVEKEIERNEIKRRD